MRKYKYRHFIDDRLVTKFATREDERINSNIALGRVVKEYEEIGDSAKGLKITIEFRVEGSKSVVTLEEMEDQDA